MTDLGILAGEIGVDALDVSDAADDLVRAINDAVVDKVDGQATRGATGLSIYFPPQVDYYAADYNEIVTDGEWIDFLSAYYGAGDAIAASDVPAASATPRVEFTDDGLTISGDFGDSAANVTTTYLRYGIPEADGSITFLGQEQAEIDDDGTARASSTSRRCEMTDGEDTVPAYLELTYDDDIITFDLPMAYYAPDGRQLRRRAAVGHARRRLERAERDLLLVRPRPADLRRAHDRPEGTHRSAGAVGGRRRQRELGGDLGERPLGRPSVHSVRVPGARVRHACSTSSCGSSTSVATRRRWRPPSPSPSRASDYAGGFTRKSSNRVTIAEVARRRERRLQCRPSRWPATRPSSPSRSSRSAARSDRWARASPGSSSARIPSPAAED